MKTGWPSLLILLFTAVMGLCAQEQTPTVVAEPTLADIDAGINGNYPLRSMQEFQLRGGLPNFFAKVQRGEDTTVVYFGTSVSAQPGWRVMTFEWLQKQFPKTKLTMVNASLGGTGSVIGAFRADKDLIAAKPDLVFIEFAGNDNPDARSRPRDVLRAMEGIVRKIRKSNPLADICFVYAFGSGDFKTLLDGKAPRGSTLHEFIAEHYGLPTIQMSLSPARLERDGKLVNAAPMTPDGLTPEGKIIFTRDGSHPTIPLGYGLWAAVVEQGLEQMKALGKAGSMPLPTPLLEDNWELAQTIPVETHVQFHGAWEKVTAANGPACQAEGQSVYEVVPAIFRTTVPGDSVTVRFKGTHVGLKGFTGPDSGIIRIQADELPPTQENQFTVYSKNYGYGGKPLPALIPGEHTVTWTLLPEKPDKQKILSSSKNKGLEKDLLEHPDKYVNQTLSAGEIQLVGQILPPNP
jgi:lysophospholipase L1-like esterase